MENKYIVLIADVIESRKISDRAEFQRLLHSQLKRLNNDRTALISPYTITIGDEFQAVFEDTNRIIQDILEIIVGIHPVKIRFSFGLGDIETDINPTSAIGMDGSAFHLAREGMDTVKKTDNYLSVRWEDVAENELFGIIFRIVAEKIKLLESWKLKKLLIFKYFFEDKPVKEISESVGVTPQSVYQTIKNINMRDIKEQLQLGKLGLIILHKIIMKEGEDDSFA